MIDITFLFFLIPGIFIGAFGSVFLKKGSNKLVFKLDEIIKNWQIFLGLFLYGVSMLLYLPALKLGNLSVVYPLSASNYAIVALLSVKFLNENMSLRKWVGISFIIMGSFLLVL